MAVRAKFIVNSIERKKHWDHTKGETQTIKLTPVTSGSEENKAFYDATPSGSIDLMLLNEDAGKQLELGKEYYVDFTPAETPSS
jgi:hypothetical protein